MTLKNPFSDFGGIVTDERFVGRKAELNQIQKRLLGEAFGNLAIIGLPRIGKSSLAWNSIIVNKENLLKKKILPVWVPLGEFSSITDVWDEVISVICDTLQSATQEASLFIALRTSFLTATSNLEKRRFIKRFLRALKINGWRLILVIDEFDNAETIFSLQDFQFLRESSYNIETKIGIITISRKTIQELEPDNGSLSNFYQIFDELRLKLFANDDILQYWQRIRNLGITISESYINHIFYYSGTHPFLMDVINYNIFNNIEQTDINIDDIFDNTLENLKLKLFNEYESILKLAEQEGLGNKLLQVIVGPVYDISQRDVEKLLKFGLIKVEKEDRYSTISEYFRAYLAIKSQEMDVWPLFSEFEIETRSIIKDFLLEKFGPDWFLTYPNKTMVSELKDNRENNRRSFKERASEDLIDYTYPKHFFDSVIAQNWEWFKPILNKDKVYWKSRFALLTKIRNPLAHNNKAFLTTEENLLATIYSKEIIDSIKSWKQTKLS